MRDITKRLKRLEKAVQADPCAGCASRVQTIHHEYVLVSGESITLPPLPAYPPCTCGQGKDPEVVAIVVKLPVPMANRAEAKRHYAEYAAAHRAWQPDDRSDTG